MPYGIIAKCVGVLLVTALVTGAVAATSPNISAPGDEAKVFTFALKKGEYIFIGPETGTKGKEESEKGVDSIAQLRIDPNTMAAAWEVQITLQPSVDEKGGKTWKWALALRYSDNDGVMQDKMTRNGPFSVAAGKKVEALEIVMIDATKEVGVEGLVYFKIPYAEVDGEKNFLIVAIAKNPGAFAKAIPIPKKYIHWDWNKGWGTYKE